MTLILTYLSMNQKHVSEEKVRQLQKAIIIFLVVFILGFLSILVIDRISTT